MINTEQNLVGQDEYFKAVNHPHASLLRDERNHALRHLDQTYVKTCRLCPHLADARKNTVFGVGDPLADICFIGEAPGANEDRLGEPFVGRAGQLLNRIIASCGLKRENVYIANIAKCRPPDNRRPLPHEVESCRPYLEQQLSIMRPRIIICLGATAAQSLLRTTDSAHRLRGKFHSYNNIPVLVTFHPAYLLRTPEKKREVWDDMQRMMAFLDSNQVH